MFNGSCLGPEDWGWPLHSHHLYFVASQIVLIGDHKQLRPIVRNQDVKKLGMATSLFERYYTSLHENRAVMLDTQYRMVRTWNYVQLECDVLFISLLCFTSTRTSVRSHQKNFMITSWRPAWISQAAPCVSTTGQCQSSLGILKERPSVWWWRLLRATTTPKSTIKRKTKWYSTRRPCFYSCLKFKLKNMKCCPTWGLQHGCCQHWLLYTLC